MSKARADEEIQPWDSDHTALVHVLWDAKHKGLTLQDADELASLIRSSRWFEAVHLHAEQGTPTRRYEWTKERDTQ